MKGIALSPNRFTTISINVLKWGIDIQPEDILCLKSVAEDSVEILFPNKVESFKLDRNRYRELTVFIVIIKVCRSNSYKWTGEPVLQPLIRSMFVVLHI